jgi:hypothetical protein
MKVAANVFFRGQPLKSDGGQEKQGIVSKKPGVVDHKPISSLAWQANTIPFASIKLSTSDFKDKMQQKIDLIREGKFERQKRTKAEVMQTKAEAVLNIKGPLVIECSEMKLDALESINRKFARVENINDLRALLDDPSIPANTPIVIGDRASQNYKTFINEVDKGNATEDVKEATAIVQAALNEIKGQEIELPEIAIKVSRKELAIGLIDHLKAGLKYEPFSIVASPFMNFRNGVPNEIAVDIFEPVYKR